MVTVVLSRGRTGTPQLTMSDMGGLFVIQYASRRSLDALRIMAGMKDRDDVRIPDGAKQQRILLSLQI